MTLFTRSRFSPRRRKSFHQNSTPATAPGREPKPGPPNMLPRPEAPTTPATPSDFIRNMEQPRLLLIVPEHACRCGYSRCRGFIASKYASDAKVDGDEALYLPCLYYFLRSDVKTGFGHFLLSEALNLMTSVLAAWTLGASVIP